MAEEREVGTVKWFDPGRGYGFIERRGAEDVYVHRSEVERAGLGTLDEGDRISFTVKKTPRGFQAAKPTLFPLVTTCRVSASASSWMPLVTGFLAAASKRGFP